MAPAAIGREKDSTAADSHSECQKSINDAVSGMPYSKGKERAISTVASTLTPAPTSQSDSSHSGDEESSYYSSSDEQNSDYSSSGDEYTEQPSQHPAVVKPREKASRICRVEKSKAASGNATSRVHEGSLLPLASTLRVVGSVARPPTQENLFEGQAMKVMNDNHKLKSWLDMRRELQYSRAGVAQKVLTKRAQDALLPVSMKGSAYCRSFLGRMQNCKNQHDPKECECGSATFPIKASILSFILVKASAQARPIEAPCFAAFAKQNYRKRAHFPTYSANTSLRVTAWAGRMLLYFLWP